MRDCCTSPSAFSFSISCGWVRAGHNQIRPGSGALEVARPPHPPAPSAQLQRRGCGGHSTCLGMTKAGSRGVATQLPRCVAACTCRHGMHHAVHKYAAPGNKTVPLPLRFVPGARGKPPLRCWKTSSAGKPNTALHNTRTCSACWRYGSRLANSW